MHEKVCVIIPGRGRQEKIEKCLSSVTGQGYPELEIIVVDDGLGEDALQVLDKFKDKIKVLKSNRRGPGFSRNLAAKFTDAEFLAFTDSDCIVAKNWIVELMRGFQEAALAASCGGRQELPDDATHFERKAFSFMKKAGFITDYTRKIKDDCIIEVNHNPSCNVMYKRDIFLKEGGFLEGLWPGEDVELDYRIKKTGYLQVFNPRAIVYHYRQKDLKSLLKMMYRYGSAQGFLVKRYGIFRGIQALPFLSLFILALFLLSLLFKLTFYFSLLICSGLLLSTIYFNFHLSVLSITVLSFLSWHLGFFKKLIR